MAKYLGEMSKCPVIELIIALEQLINFDKNINVGNGDTLSQ